MINGLNSQEEAFARAVALEGMGPSAAYRHAYGSKMAPDAVASNAKRVLRRSRIKRRIAELKDQSPGGPFGLTPKQDAFCRFYVEKSNASEAYRLAYDVSPETKPATINRSAAELLANPKITARVADLYAGLQRRHEGIVDKLKGEYEKLAFFDISEAIQWGETVVTRNPESGEIEAEAQSVQIKSSKDMPPQIRAAIASIEQTKDGCLKVRFHDKKGALDSLAKMHGLFKEVHEHTGKGGGPMQFQSLDVKRMSDEELEEFIRRGGIEVLAKGQKNGAAHR